jgi:hypothetical protein
MTGVNVGTQCFATMAREVIGGTDCCTTMTSDHINARMNEGATMTPDHIGARIT